MGRDADLGIGGCREKGLEGGCPTPGEVASVTGKEAASLHRRRRGKCACDGGQWPPVRFPDLEAKRRMRGIYTGDSAGYEYAGVFW